MIDRRTVLRIGALGATGAVVTAGTGTALAASDTPDAGRLGTRQEFDWIIDCAGWGARPASGQLEPSQTPTNKIIVHHMAFPNVEDYSREQAIALARDCQDLHMDDNGWSDTGQHFTVSRGGFVLEGRHGSLEALSTGSNQVIAAHCPGENGRAIGIENEGTYVEVTPPEQQVDALVRLLVGICQQYGLYAHDIFGHWDFRDTQCPGAAFYAQFPELRRRVATDLGTPDTEIPERRWPDPWRFGDSPVVAAMQYLLSEHGYGLTPDGIYGQLTLQALQDFQQSNGLEPDPDGTCTPETWENLVTEIRPGSTGDAVSGLQFMLERKLIGQVTVTGEYDQATAAAVGELRALHGLDDGEGMNANAWCAVVGGSVRQAFVD